MPASMTDNRTHIPTEGGPEPLVSESWLGRHAPYLLLLGYLYYCTQVAMEILAIGEIWDHGVGWNAFGDRFGWLSEMLPLVAGSLIVLMATAFFGVALRVVGQVLHRVSGPTILRDILGEPSWWRAWYPRSLRDPSSLWDRLPPTLKVARTAVWSALLLLPAGFVMVVFVLPTFQTVYEILGFQFPSMMRAYTLAVTVGGYVLPVMVLAALVQASLWRTRYGLSRSVAFTALFSVRRHFWQDTDARELLRG